MSESGSNFWRKITGKEAKISGETDPLGVKSVELSDEMGLSIPYPGKPIQVILAKGAKVLEIGRPEDFGLPVKTDFKIREVEGSGSSAQFKPVTVELGPFVVVDKETFDREKGRKSEGWAYLGGEARKIMVGRAHHGISGMNFSHPNLSRDHVEISSADPMRPNDIFIRDLNSLNGTTVAIPVLPKTPPKT
jgi:hypothetical protein